MKSPASRKKLVILRNRLRSIPWRLVYVSPWGGVLNDGDCVGLVVVLRYMPCARARKGKACMAREADRSRGMWEKREKRSVNALTVCRVFGVYLVL